MWLKTKVPKSAYIAGTVFFFKTFVWNTDLCSRTSDFYEISIIINLSEKR